MFGQIMWDVSPILIDFGGFQLRYYSVAFALAFVSAYLILKRIFKKEDVPTSELDSLTTYVAIGALVGARIGHCIFYEWAYFSQHFFEIFLPVRFTPEFEFIGFQGLASHGGAIGIIIAILLFKRKSKNKSFFWTIDRVAIVTGFAGAFIRIMGNLMNSEIFGHQTDLPWGFVFVRAGMEEASHPTQLYEGLCYIITSIVLLQLYKKEKFRNAKGFLLGVFLVMVFSARFFIEFLKINQVAFEESMLLNMGQILSIPAVICGLFLMFWSLKKYKS